jgi:histidinol-phosphate/aromatic aminotransferase/cobyric acid decarboxylase-like protein
VGGLSEAAALAALTVDRGWVREKAAEVMALRERFGTELLRRGFEPLASEGNFLLVPVREAEAMAARMRERGVSVRAFPQLPSVGDALRITIGPWPMLEACLRALEEARA